MFFKKTKIFFIILISGFLLFGSNIADAGPEDNIYGWAWSENIGWISFNNISGGGSTDYGVSVDINTGVMSGAAWSENIGWISFNSDSLSGCPGFPCEAYMGISTNEISGWARACSVFASGCSGALAPDNVRGGWDGFIKLRGSIAIGGTYGLWADSIYEPYHIKNWAWSDNVIGWISSNCSNAPGTCAVSDYKVFLSLNHLPYVEIGAPQVIGPNPGITDCPIYAFFKWKYYDPDGDRQNWYTIEVADNPGFSDPYIFSSQQIIEDGTETNSSYYPVVEDASGLAYDLPQNATLFWRIKVEDEGGAWSLWEEGPSFTTPLHQDPLVDFSWDPVNALIDDVVFFYDETTFYDSVCSADPDDASCLYLWSFPADAVFEDGTDANTRNPHISFPTPGYKTITLTATDSDGYTCSNTKSSLNISGANIAPKWWEVIPF